MSVLRKSIEVLSCFSSDAPFLTVTQVTRQTSLSKSAASRLLAQMEELGLLTRPEGERHYGPGTLLLQLGAVFEQRFEVLPLLEAEVVSAVQTTGRTGYIGVLSGSNLVALRTIQGREQLRFVLEAGQQLSAHKTSLGKALLARLSNTEIRKRYAGDLGEPVDHAPASFSKLFDELDKVRQTLVAEANIASIPGAKGIGAAIGNRSGNESATVGFSLSFLDDGSSEERRLETVSEVMKIGRTVAALTGDPIWTWSGHGANATLLRADRR